MKEMKESVTWGVTEKESCHLQYAPFPIDIKDFIAIRNFKCVSYFILPIDLDN
jgi:hypothetical protein